MLPNARSGYTVTARGTVPGDLARRVAAAHAEALRAEMRRAATDKLADQAQEAARGSRPAA